MAVRNRSSDENISLEEARRREKEFFRQGAIVSTTGWDCLGIEALINRLSDLYADRVRDTFPKIRAEIQIRLKDITEQLSKFPPNLETSAARLAKYYELADAYVENVVRVRFNHSSGSQYTSIVNNLHKSFAKFQEIIQRQSNEFRTEAYRKKVAQAMEACFGEQLPNFLPHPILKRMINEKLNDLWRAAQTLLNESFHMAVNLLTDKDEDACQGDLLLLKLLPTFRNIGKLMLKGKKSSMHDQFQEMIRVEKQEPYTLNPEYMSLIGQFKQYAVDKKAPTMDPNLKQMSDSMLAAELPVQDMVISIYAYWQILTRRFIDYATLSLRSACIFDVCPAIRQRLRELPVEQTHFVDTHLAEDVVIRTRRKQLMQTKDRLEKVEAVLGDGFGIADEQMLAEASPADASMVSLDEFAKTF